MCPRRRAGRPHLNGVLVVGGSNGVGRETVRLLARDARVTFTYASDRSRADALRAELPGTEAVSYAFGDEASHAALVARCETAEFDSAVFCAFPAHRPTPLESVSGEAMRRMLEPSVRYLELARAIAGGLQSASRTGSMVFVLSTVVATTPPRKQVDYVTGKHALLGLVRGLAVDLAPRGIRVNAVAPSLMATAYVSHLPERYLQVRGESAPLGRLLSPAEVAVAIVFLLSDRSAYITGQNLVLDGAS